MSGNGPGQQELAAQAALALAEAFMPRRGSTGQVEVRIDDAHVFASGRVDLWSGWERLPADVQQLVGRFIRVRNNELGSRGRFRMAACDLGLHPDSPYAVPQGVELRDVTVLRPRHGQNPLRLAEALIEEAEAKYRKARRPLPAARPGRWTFGFGNQSIVEIPDKMVPDAVAPITIDIASAAATIKVDKQALFDLADEFDTAGRGSMWQRAVLHTLFDGLKNIDDITVSELVLQAGRIQLLNAPTGVGKSVLTRLLAVHLARIGITVAVVVGTIGEAQNAAENIAEQDAQARRAAAEIKADLSALGDPARCAVLITPRRIHEKAVLAASREEWERFDDLAYGCALAPWMVDRPAPEPGNEPCASLLPHMATDASASAKRDQNKRHICPRLGECGKFDGIRAAASANIIITNHHNLIHGSIRVPVTVDGEDYRGITVLEFLTRRCAVLVIDEIDRFQSNMFDSGARELVLSANTGVTDLPLAQLNAQRAMLLPREDRNLLPALSRTLFLADQFLNYVLESDLWLESASWLKDERDRGGSGWHIPGSNDRLLLLHLFGVDKTSDEIPREVYEKFNALFPDNPEDAPAAALDKPLQKVADLLRTVVANEDGVDHLREVTNDLHNVLPAWLKKVAKQRAVAQPGSTPLPDGVDPSAEPKKPPTQDDIRREVVNALLVRTWLGALHQALTGLTFAAGRSDTELPAAQKLIDQLGTFVQHAAVPFGPLGYLLFGFRVDRASDGTPRGQLSVQAIAGDPHTTTVQLGDLVSLTYAGARRIVVGLSATAFFPGAAREHIHTDVTWAMTDADPGAFTTKAGQVLDAELIPLQIGGQSERRKADAVDALGQALWEQRLDDHLRVLAQNDPQRERCLLVGNSYKQAALLGAGVARTAPDPAWVAVVVPKDVRRGAIPLPAGVVTVTIEDLEDLPRRYPEVKVCSAPLGLVARGLNILVPGDQRSALASIWVCVRPVLQLNVPAEILASVNAHALGIGEPGEDPAGVLAEQTTAAFTRLYKLLATDPRFSRLPRHLKAEAVAGMLVDMIQLAGRARRGKTPVELHLVDNAFHNAALGSDLAGILAFYYRSLTPSQQRALGRIYGSTLASWLDFASIDHILLQEDW